LVHRFSTILGKAPKDNMWASCGSAARPCAGIPHGGGAAPRYARTSAGWQQFYPIRFLGPAACEQAPTCCPSRPFTKKTRPPVVFGHPVEKSPSPSQGYGALLRGPGKGQPRAG